MAKGIETVGPTNVIEGIVRPDISLLFSSGETIYEPVDGIVLPYSLIDESGVLLVNFGGAKGLTGGDVSHHLDLVGVKARMGRKRRNLP